ncbi:hypothetical protein ACFVXC_05585 [Streptomyces sp. NPDC058257]|uniref:hypothetical protein n=1 Tax=Streptomyces sp. NPDC058257 TaxID=3346409 RepID=UPI0036E48017
MTQQAPSIDELLTKWGEAYRASLPQWTPEEEALYWRDYNARFYAKVHAELDAANVVICCLCHARRPRKSPDGPRYYASGECENVRQPWHYHRDWTVGANQKNQRREARRHQRRLRKGRLPHVPA